MKLGSRDAARYFSRPEPQRTGLLIYGPDGMRVALKRQEMLAALLGPGAEEEMRLARLAAADLRKDRAALLDAVKAQGFFPGPRAVLVDEAGDGVAEPILAALDDWAEGDAQIVVTAGQLKPTSKLRKAFESHPNAYAAAIYDDPPSREEIEAVLARAGLRDIPGAVMGDLVALSRALDPGDFRQTVEKLALYKMGDDTPLAPQDIAAFAPPRPRPTWMTSSMSWPRGGRAISGRCCGGCGRRGCSRWGCASARRGISGRSTPPPPIPAEPPRASPACARRSSAHAATGCCGRRSTGGRGGSNRRWRSSPKPT